MSDHAFLDLVNHAELDPRYGAYAGFDGVILHAQRQRETGEIVDVDLRGPGQIECDIAYTGLRRIMITEDASPSIPAYPAGFYVFAGFDVGKFDLEYGAYSLIINYGLDGRRRPPALNRFFLFDRREDAASLLGAWTADPSADKETFMADEILAPHAVYRRVSSREG